MEIEIQAEYDSVQEEIKALNQKKSSIAR